jgi:hypothetical protein
MEKKEVFVNTYNIVRCDNLEPQQPSGTLNCIDTTNGKQDFQSDFVRTPAGREIFLRISYTQSNRTNVSSPSGRSIE